VSLPPEPLSGSAVTDVDAPAYRREPWHQRHVHIGLGAFSRAHIAVYADRLLRAHQLDWGIVGANLRSDDVASQLHKQDGLYTLLVADGDNATAQVIGSVACALGGRDHRMLIDQLASPATSFVTVTVTEKGYGYDASRQLDLAHPAIAGDLAHPTTPASLVGLLVESLSRRQQAKTPALSIVSCDNIDDNGGLLRSLVLTFAERRAPSLARWVDRHVAFPSTMVDRIVPATTEKLRAQVRDLTGRDDLAPVGAEPFSQWVIESSMAADHPPLDTVGVEVVDDVRPFVQMKLRILNGLHSAAAYLGTHRGTETIDTVVTNEKVFLNELLGEILPTLRPPTGFDMQRYGEMALERFANPWLGHRCQQVATDGSVKLAQRLYPTILARLQRGLPVEACTRALALWIEHVARSGNELVDPHAMELTARLAGARSSRDMALAILSDSALVPGRLAQADVVDLVAKHLDQLHRDFPPCQGQPRSEVGT
jgi:fructuronate reductase